MRLEVSESVAPENWDQQVCASGGNIHHSSIWASYVKATRPGIVPQFMSLVSPDGERCGVALAFYESSRHRLLSALTGRLWLDTIPATRDRKLLTEFLRLLESRARDSGAVELFIESYGLGGGRQEMEEAGFELIPRLEFELQLEKSEQELWKDLNPKRAGKIKKALKMGVAIKDLPGAQGLSELRRLQAESSRRIVERGGPDVAPSATDGDDPLQVLLASGCARIAGAQLDGAIRSSGLFTRFNGLVYVHMSGHDDWGIKSQTGTLLLWEMVKRYRNEGAKRFSFGGCQIDAVNEDSPEHGVYVYKKGFGGTCVECFSGRKTLRKTTNKVMTTLKSLLGNQQAAG